MMTARYPDIHPVAAAFALAIVAVLAGCSASTEPAQQSRQVTLAQTVTLVQTDSAHVAGTVAFDAPSLNAAFDAVKERIVTVSCAPPTVTALSVSIADSGFVDTLCLFVGSDTSSATDTLSGPTFLSRAQLSEGNPQVMWAHTSGLWRAGHLLGSAPYAVALRITGHATRPVIALQARIELPLTVISLQ